MAHRDMQPSASIFREKFDIIRNKIFREYLEWYVESCDPFRKPEQRKPE